MNKAEMDLVEHSSVIIRNMLTRFPYSIKRPEPDKLAVFVNKLIFHDCCKLFKLDYQPTSWDYTFQIDNKKYEMNLIIIPMETNEQYDYIQNLILMAQFSMPWMDRLTLFSDLRSYSKLEEFIQHHRLRPYIVSTIDQIGPTLNDKIIRVVTFSKQLYKFGLIKKFGDTVKPRLIDYFFITCAFPWLQPNVLKQIIVTWENHHLLHKTLPVILQHLSTINYSNELDMFDLISLKLAIYDFPGVSNYLTNEIDYFVAQSVRQMLRNKTYLIGKQFNLTQYAYDKNFVPSALIKNHLVYEFQKYIEFLQYDYRDSNGNPTKTILYRTIVLSDLGDPIRILESKSNIEFTIDGSNFSEMTFSLFTELLVHDSVAEIILDTDYPWIDNAPVTIRYINTRTKINFVGSNNAKFIENFVTSLKTSSNSEMLELTITQSLSDYTVFDNFNCYSLHFLGLIIDTDVLSGLNQCNLSQIVSVKFFSCRWENKVENWELYFSTKQILGLEIREDEWTWQYLFEFIANRLINSSENEFTFHKEATIVFGGVPVSLCKLSFRFDEFKTKLELLDENMQTVDLYDVKLSLIINED